MLLKDHNGFPQLTQKRQNTYINTHINSKENNNGKAQNIRITMQQQGKIFGHV